MNFAELNDLEAILGRQAQGGGETENWLYLLDSATALIKNWTRQDIVAVENDEITLLGTWGANRALPQRPVTAVTEVTIDGEAVTEFTFDTDQLIRSSFPTDGFDLSQSLNGRNWGGPTRTVAVTYSHGYATVPDDIKAVCLEVVMASSYNVTDTDRTAPLSVKLTAENRRVLRRYRRSWL